MGFRDGWDSPSERRIAMRDERIVSDPAGAGDFSSAMVCLKGAIEGQEVACGCDSGGRKLRQEVRKKLIR